MEKERIIQPVDGDYLFEADKRRDEKAVYVPCRTNVQKDGYRINGILLRGPEYTADIPLENDMLTLALTDENGNTVDTVKVYDAKQMQQAMRFSVDDNIWFLKDIAKNKDSYTSIFDNQFLSMFKKLHDRFNTKVHFNLYYQDDEFDLSKMPVKYKDEWRDNSDWIALTFHGLANDPDKPYLNTTYEKIFAHANLVTNEIIRFAGEELLSPYTTIHWGEVTEEGCRALKDFGFKGLLGYFLVRDGAPAVSYCLDLHKTKHLEKRDAWKDHDLGLSFIKIDLVLNMFDTSKAIEELKKVISDPHQSGFLELMIHEQYFYPHYAHYQKDYEQKIMAAVEYATHVGYQPVFLKDVML